MKSIYQNQWDFQLSKNSLQIQPFMFSTKSCWSWNLWCLIPLGDSKRVTHVKCSFNVHILHIFLLHLLDQCRVSTINRNNGIGWTSSQAQFIRMKCKWCNGTYSLSQKSIMVIDHTQGVTSSVEHSHKLIIASTIEYKSAGNKQQTLQAQEHNREPPMLSLYSCSVHQWSSHWNSQRECPRIWHHQLLNPK